MCTLGQTLPSIETCVSLFSAGSQSYKPLGSKGTNQTKPLNIPKYSLSSTISLKEDFPINKSLTQENNQ